MAKRANKPTRSRVVKRKMKKRDVVGGMNLTDVKESISWDDLAETHKETMASIQAQIAMVEELQKKCPEGAEEEVIKGFDGLIKSFRDLIIDTATNGVQHAVTTTSDTMPNGKVLEYATEFMSGPLDDDDDALEYINVGSKYYNTQEKVMALMSTGWVDLFTTMKMSKVKEIREAAEGEDEDVQRAN